MLCYTESKATEKSKCATSTQLSLSVKLVVSKRIHLNVQKENVLDSVSGMSAVMLTFHVVQINKNKIKRNNKFCEVRNVFFCKKTNKQKNI